MSTIDLIVRSRPVILEILDSRGYDVSSYKDVSPVDIYTMASSKTSILTITAKRKIPESIAPKERAIVVYWTENKLYRQSAASTLEKWFEKMAITEKVAEEGENEEGETNEDDEGSVKESEDELSINPQNDEIIIILSELFHEQYNQLALTAWGKKVRVSFFPLKNLISNPAKHFMVPAHRKLTSDEAEEVRKSQRMKSIHEFPHIKFHFDMQARVLGLVPGDLVEIKRPSETAGITTLYRVCLA